MGELLHNAATLLSALLCLGCSISSTGCGRPAVRNAHLHWLLRLGGIQLATSPSSALAAATPEWPPASTRLPASVAAAGQGRRLHVRGGRRPTSHSRRRAQRLPTAATRLPAAPSGGAGLSGRLFGRAARVASSDCEIDRSGVKTEWRVRDWARSRRMKAAGCPAALGFSFNDPD